MFGFEFGCAFRAENHIFAKRQKAARILFCEKIDEKIEKFMKKLSIRVKIFMRAEQLFGAISYVERNVKMSQKIW